VQVFGLMMVRNEADILRINLLYHLALGIDHFLVIDNGSSDGTSEILKELSRDTGLVHWTRDEGPYRQAEVTTALAHEAYLRGADWVLPIDADEFWHAPQGDFRGFLERSAAAALEVRVVNFVQRREQLEITPDALLHMTRRVAVPIGPIERIAELVETCQIGFVQMLYPSKWLSRASPALEIGMGNHNVRGVAGNRAATDQIVCLHAPLRARSVLEAKMVDLGRRAEDEGALGGEKLWHYRRWRRLGDENGLESEWRANSYFHDALDVYGLQHSLVSDNTLQQVVAPFIEGAASVEHTADCPASPPSLSLGDQVLESRGQFVGPVMARVRQIEGWLFEPEASLLMAAAALALTEQEPHSVVEVGSYRGRSTVALGSVVKAVCPAVRVYAIDPHDGQVSTRDTETRFEEPSLEAFKRNIAEAGLEDIVELIQQHSFDVRWTRPISLLFIDGLHDYENVSRDFAHFDPWVVRGGYVAFDDYDTAFPGVIAFVHEVLTSGKYQEVLRVGRIIVTQKASNSQRGVVKAENVEDAIGAGQQKASEPSVSAEWIPWAEERLARQEKGLSILREVVREEFARHEEVLGERDSVIRGLQAELDEKVGEANRVISDLQAEMQLKVGEANSVIRGLQAQLAGDRVAVRPRRPASDPRTIGADTPAPVDHDGAISALELELAALRRSRALRIVGAYYRLRERLQAGVRRLQRWTGERR
jgi:predicted O-methyltransferase YrrM